MSARKNTTAPINASRSSNRFTPLQGAILRTLCYADVFDFPLTLQEVWKFLISRKGYTQLEVGRAIKTLRGMHRGSKFICLPGRWEIISRRKTNLSVQISKLRATRGIVSLIGWLPTISAIFVTGSLAAKNSVALDDIDLMVVTKPGWLWTTRAVVALLCVAVGKYRTRSTATVRNMWCFNMWVDESALSISSSAQNLYTAHEVAQALPLLDKRNIAERFLDENRWAKKYLANAISVQPQPEKEKAVGSTPPIEQFLFLLQRRYMQPVRTIEKVNLHYAFFHPRDTRADVLGSYNAKIAKL